MTQQQQQQGMFGLFDASGRLCEEKLFYIGEKCITCENMFFPKKNSRKKILNLI